MIKLALKILNLLWLIVIAVSGLILFKAPQIIIEIIGPGGAFICFVAVIHLLFYKMSINQLAEQATERGTEKNI